ncbi:hypothetical protein BH24ACT5_BH24ACT5_24440 [soil metagenome]
MRTITFTTTRRAVGALAALTLVGALSATAVASSDTEPEGGSSDGRNSEWFDQEQFDAQLAARDATPEGPEGEPWLQSINPTMTDTSEYAAEGPYEICFSNTDVGNPWRQVGWTTMQEEVALHDEIETFTVLDAGGSEEKQIADIAELVSRGTCDVLIVSPASTAALTPAIESACESLPVIVFDRGVDTDCPVTFIHPAGGYLFGADAAEFLVDNVPEGGNIVALRILPGVDVLETRWVAGQIIMEEAGLNIIASEFTDGDAAKVKSILQDLIDRGEQIDGVWMDAGATSVAAIEAFEENGLDVPPITGEDQQDFLIKWRDEGLTAVAPTYPTYQWRTPILAALMLLGGEEIPGGEWLLPQPVITSDDLDSRIDDSMPPLFYAMCGCQDMPNFPDAWQG